MSVEKLTIAKEYQNLLYSLLNEKVMSLEGPALPGEDGRLVIHVSREEMVDRLIQVLNSFGESMHSDRRLKDETK